MLPSRPRCEQVLQQANIKPSFVLGGDRSRTRKLRPPRYGALRYVVDAVKNSEGPEVIVAPVSVVYDQLAEVAAMTAEALGGSKTPEGIGWLLRFAKAQESRNATVRIDFGAFFDSYRVRRRT